MKKNMLALISRYRAEIMGVAALWVLLVHEWRSIFGASILGRAERFFVAMGFYGVDFFLFLSGMGLVYAIGKYTLKEFYRRRFVRLLLPYLITVPICALLRGWEFGAFLRALVGWSFWMEDMYTVLWYVYAIAALYLTFPLYYHFFRKARRKALFTALVLLVWFLASNALNGILRMDLYGFTNRIPIFLTGVLAGEMGKEKKEWHLSWKAWVLCIVMLMAGVVLHYLTYYKFLFVLVPSSECFLPDYLITVSGVCLLAQFFSLLDRFAGALGKEIRHFLRFLGGLSLELYCVQDMMLGRLQALMYDILPDWASNLVNFWVILFAAYIMQQLCAFLNKKLKFL